MLVDPQPGWSLLALLVVSLAAAGELINELHWSTGLGAVVWIALIGGGFVVADKMEKASRERARSKRLATMRERAAAGVGHDDGDGSPHS